MVQVSRYAPKPPKVDKLSRKIYAAAARAGRRGDFPPGGGVTATAGYDTGRIHASKMERKILSYSGGKQRRVPAGSPRGGQFAR